MKQKKSPKENLLWKIYDRNSSHISYLYGTIHLRDKRVYFLIDKIKQLICTCDIFIAEYDLEDSEQPEILQALKLPDNKHLRNYLPAKKYEKIKKRFSKAFNIDIDRFGFFKPIAVENMITESLFKNDYNCPMDFELWNFAKEKGKIVLGAESTASQINIMKNLSVKNQVRSLIKISQNTSKYRKNINRLVGYYENQKISLLYKNSLKSLGRLKKILVYNRNLSITASILNQVNNGSVFVAVGAGHLPGEKGIIRLLKEKGFSVQPMKILKEDRNS